MQFRAPLAKLVNAPHVGGLGLMAMLTLASSSWRAHGIRPNGHANASELQLVRSFLYNG